MHYHLSPRELKKRKINFKTKVYLLLLLIGLFLIGSLYIVRDSSIFKIKKISISGLNTQEQQELITDIETKFLANFIPRFLGKDNFLAWPGEVKFSNIKFSSVVLHKNLLRREITLNATKREKLGIWCFLKNCFWFDKADGLLMEEAPIPDGQIVFKITEERSENPKIGDRVLPAELFANFKKILATAKELSLSLEVIQVSSALQEMRLKTNEKALLIFSLRSDPAISLLPALKKILNETPLQKINYIDMTVENKIYLKVK